MCYNIAYMEKRAEKYAQRYKDVIAPEWKPVQLELPISYFQSGFAHPLVPVVKRDGIFLFRWGLIPFWVKDEQGAKDIRMKTLNAVGETVFEKPSFRKSIASQRCIVGVNGFFEWRDFNKSKYPYYIKVRGMEIFSLACLYDEWLNKTTGEIVHSFSIITTDANPLMQKIHNLKKRMPLILNPEDEAKWVSSELTRAEIAELIKPFDENKMEAYTISKDANSTRKLRDIPEILEPVIYPELD